MLFDGAKTRKALRDSQERIENLERDFRKMRLEWEDTYDKLQTIVQRIVKRAQRAEQLTEEMQSGGDVVPDAASSPSLDPRRQTLQQKILERRARVLRPS